MAGHMAAEATNMTGTISTSNLFYFLLIPTAILWLVYFKLSRRHLVELGNKIPGPKGFPIIGNLLDLMGSSHSK